MKYLLLLAGLAFASAFQGLTYETSKKYVYEYEGYVLSGVPQSSNLYSGIRITAKPEISIVERGRAVLKVQYPKLYTFNGTRPGSDFVEAPEMTSALAPLLSEPVMFEYVHGKVGRIFAPADLPDVVVNIHRGIINILHINMTSSEGFFVNKEIDIGGICETAYSVVDLKDVTTIVKTKDYEKCIVRPAYYWNFTRSMQYVLERQAPPLRSAATFRYNLTEAGSGYIIKDAHSEGQHIFTPFSEYGGSAQSIIKQKLRFVDKMAGDARAPSDLPDRGNLMYAYPRERASHYASRPVKTEEIGRILESLSNEMSFEKISVEAPGYWIILVQHLRQCSVEAIREIWTNYASKPHYKKFLIDILPIVGTEDAITALTNIVKAEPAIVKEYTAYIFTGLAFTPEPTPAIMEKIQALINDPIVNEYAPARRAALLAYGGIVNNLCYYRRCPTAVVDFLTSKYESARDDAEREVILKSMGNAGVIEVVPYIRKLFKRPETLPLKIQVAAIQALRRIAPRHPVQTSSILMPIFLDTRYATETRLVACTVLFLTRPTTATVVTIAEQLIVEPNNQVASFVYSHIRNLANNTVPMMRPVARAAATALRFARIRSGLGYRYANSMHASYYEDKLNIGGFVDVHVLKTPHSFMPKQLYTKINLQLMGLSIDVMEVGVRAEGIQNLIERITEPQSMFRKKKTLSEMLIRQPRSSEDVEQTEQTVKKLYRYKPVKESDTEFGMTMFIRMFGNELYLFNVDRDYIRDVVQHGSIGIDINNIERRLSDGLSYKWLKSMPIYDSISSVPTILGLPLNLNVTSAWISTLQVSTSARAVRDSTVLEPKRDHFVSRDPSNDWFSSSSSSSESNSPSRSSEEIPNSQRWSSESESISAENSDSWSRSESRSRSTEQRDPITGVRAVGQMIKNDAIHVHVRMGVDAIVVQTGIGIAVKTRNSFPLIGEVNCDVSQRKYTFDMKPVERVHENVQLTSDIFTFMKRPSELYGQYSILTPQVPAVLNARSPVVLDEECCDWLKKWDIKACYNKLAASRSSRLEPVEETKICIPALKKVLGIEYCLLIHNAQRRGTAAVPFYPLQGSMKFATYLIAGENSPASIQLAVSNIKPIPMTPESLIRGQIQSEIKLQAIDSQSAPISGLAIDVMYDGAASERKLEIKGKIINREDLRMRVLIKSADPLSSGEWTVDLGDHAINNIWEIKRDPAQAIVMKTTYDTLPEIISVTIERLSGMALTYLYYTNTVDVKYVENTPRTIESRVTFRTPYIADVEIRCPAYSIRRRGIPMKIPVPVLPAPGTPVKTVVADTTTFFLKELDMPLATCQVVGDHYSTYDNVTYDYALPGECHHVLTMDGAKETFMVLINRKKNQPQKIITAFIQNKKIELMPNMAVKVQDKAIKFDKANMYTIPDILEIQKYADKMVLTAKIGLTITYTGETVMATVMPTYHGKTVGLCSNDDDEQSGEFMLPDHTVVNDPKLFAHGWIVRGEKCTDACQLSSQYAIRNEYLGGEERKCFSTVPVTKCLRGCVSVEQVPVDVGFHCMPKGLTSTIHLEEDIKSDRLESINLSTKTIDTVKSTLVDVSCDCDRCINLSPYSPY
ncbi:vitellogenin-like [Saccoglossus kowalevskii]|uniref:Vitellogenin-A2-like n=1 Tax=Saccoglossus kowalevskii TaxID=10224 RepID=A0ABM0LU14_SACKO|nr:PREDICTED: vitellogenin-A2-like [Saccoglossus kowalevskii]